MTFVSTVADGDSPSSKGSCRGPAAPDFALDARVVAVEAHVSGQGRWSGDTSISNGSEVSVPANQSACCGKSGGRSLCS